MPHSATIADPRHLARILASFARDGLARVGAADDSRLMPVRESLEGALGIHFDDERGGRFFHSALVQTLFYGIFSAWVLWSRQAGSDGPLLTESLESRRFRWREAVRHLQVPVLRALFRQITDPGHLGPLGIIEVLDRSEGVLNRVDRSAFFDRLREGEAVPYFYEPFLKEFDPDLRKQLGVWYTPPEVVRYMVARVDNALKRDFQVRDGLAADNVHVLDPCCGTGTYLSEVLRRIASNLRGRKRSRALVGAHVRRAALRRVHGFEIMPAPFVIANLQVGLTLEDLDGGLSGGESGQPQIFLTNALTGWESAETGALPLPELEEERSRARKVKQDTPILVVLGNPPYNAFAGVCMDEEKDLSDAYRTVRRVQRPKGRGLSDLYVRFFRMAERRITEKTGEGIVCLITNNSWLDGDSFPGMREHYLDAFDIIRVDCLHGSKHRTGKRTPEGLPDPSVFSTLGKPVSIQVGTAIATLVRKRRHRPARTVGYRDVWGQGKLAKLSDTAEARESRIYQPVRPEPLLGLPFIRASVGQGWKGWPELPDLFPCHFPGVETDRDRFLVDSDLGRLKRRIREYCDPGRSDERIAQDHPEAMRASRQFDPHAARRAMLKRGGPVEENFVRFAYRPFDTHWLYRDSSGILLAHPGVDHFSHVVEGSRWLVTQRKSRKEWTPPQAASSLGCRHLVENGAMCFPLWLNGDGVGEEAGPAAWRPNLTCAAQKYLGGLGAGPEDLFHFVLACLHDPGFRAENSDALRQGWPRVPLPGWPCPREKGDSDAFFRTARVGRKLALLLDPGREAPGITGGRLRRDAAATAAAARRDGEPMSGDDFVLDAGWGHLGVNGVVMPGAGSVVERDYRREERAALGKALAHLGATTLDVRLNGDAHWANVPVRVWDYSLGGYQVLRKWLSYRAHAVRGLPLDPGEVEEFTRIARRIGAILALVGQGTLGAADRDAGA